MNILSSLVATKNENKNLGQILGYFPLKTPPGLLVIYMHATLTTAASYTCTCNSVTGLSWHRTCLGGIGAGLHDTNVHVVGSYFPEVPQNCSLRKASSSGDAMTARMPPAAAQSSLEPAQSLAGVSAYSCPWYERVKLSAVDNKNALFYLA